MFYFRFGQVSLSLRCLCPRTHIVRLSHQGTCVWFSLRYLCRGIRFFSSKPVVVIIAFNFNFVCCILGYLFLFSTSMNVNHTCKFISQARTSRRCANLPSIVLQFLSGQYPKAICRQIGRCGFQARCFEILGQSKRWKNRRFKGNCSERAPLRSTYVLISIYFSAIISQLLRTWFY